ncbi:TIR domain-containing protein [Streptomyces microflavus]|uniref:Toll/interleukin-1 receptor domain-containing protein n=1 Tax=Streptomyces microflavus TaxID=1919 RepID=A0A7H8MSS0_STRMI|nr:TIR domain-containing protein [Streptomyces microflavus]QKW45190.1 toll/interleukin-1 receptor domain-containing protein [Streptomyces microflavus]
MTTPGPNGIFVNYRVGDCETEAALLHRLLADRFGDEQVFFASSSIRLSADFTEALPEGLARSSVLIAVIGPEWLTVKDGQGTPRIQLKEDWVRRELAYCFHHGIPVIPVLIDRGRRIRTPSAAELPDDLAQLERCQYLRMHYQSLRLERLFAELAVLTPQTFAHRVLLPAEELPPEPVPSMLLRAEYGVVPFHGREAEQEELHAWCAEPAESAARLVTGPGGQGKTRLALHLCQQALGQGWLAGFVDESCAPDDLVLLARCTAPLLLVFDYAEARADQLLLLAAACARRDADAGPVRLLLLSRAGGEWQRPLAEHSDDRVALLFAAMTERRLAPLVPSEAQRQAEFVGAAQEFSAHLTGTRPEAAAVPADLGAARYDRILDVHAAAMVALLEQDEPLGSVPSTSPDPVARVLAHERRYWKRLLAVHALPEDTTLHADALIAVATLFGAGTEEGAIALLSATPTFEDTSLPLRRRHLRWASAVLQGGTGLHPLRPDRLGEEHVAHVLDSLPEVATAPLPGLDDGQARRALTVLGRAAVRHPVAASAVTTLLALDIDRMLPLGMEVASQLENPRVFARTLLDGLQAHDDGDTVRLVLDHLPDESTALADLAVLASELTLRNAEQHASLNPAATARLLLRYTYHLKSSGRRREGLSAAEEAAGLFEQLAVDSRQTHLPDLGRALHGFAVMLDETGERGRGLDTIRRAVEVRKELCERSDVYLPELALSLDVLGADLAERGHRAEGLAAGQEAVRIFEGLAADRPVLYEAQLATALGNLALQWERFGNPGEACAVSARCVDVLRRLSDQNPDAHLLKYAEALNHHASALARADRRAEALAPVVEAVELLRVLVETDPGLAEDASNPSVRLASALVNLSIVRSANGLHAEALASAVEAVEAHRRLAEALHGVHRPRLAVALTTLAARYGAAGNFKEALAAAIEAVRIRRHDPEGRPADLAHALGNLAALLARAKQWAYAEKTAADAVAVYLSLGDLDEQVHVESLAGALHTRAAAASHVEGATDRMVEAIDASVELRRAQAAALGGRHETALTSALFAQAVLHERAGLPDATAIHAEAAKRRDAPLKRSP